MNSRTIQRHLFKVYTNWYDSLQDEELKKKVRRATIITGGSITSLLLNEPVKDYDIYFDNKETTLAVAKYYVDIFNKNYEKVHNNNIFNKKITLPQVYVVKDEKVSTEKDFDRIRIKIKSAGIIGEQSDSKDYEYFEGDTSDNPAAENFTEQATNETESVNFDFNAAVSDADEIDGNLLDTYKNENKEMYRPVFLSDNAISLSGRIQLIIRFYGNPEQIHENFDFIHCTNYWNSENLKLVLNKEALESIVTKQLEYMGSKYPICSIVRLRRFIKKGWNINAGQILKICMQISKLDLTKVEVLEEQLTGVDTAYFHELIKLLNKEQKKIGSDKPIESAYIVTLIDKLFG